MPFQFLDLQPMQGNKLIPRSVLLYTAKYCTRATISSTARKEDSPCQRGGMLAMTSDAAHDQIWRGQSLGQRVKPANFAVCRLKHLSHLYCRRLKK